MFPSLFGHKVNHSIYTFCTQFLSQQILKLIPSSISVSTFSFKAERPVFKLSSFLSTHRLVVTATDRGSPRLAGSATLTVIIVDQNDNSPTIPLPQEVRIPESKHAEEFYTSYFLSYLTLWKCFCEP